MRKEERVKEIRKAIRLLGWVHVNERIKDSGNPRDQKILDELTAEFRANDKARADKILENHHIKL